MASNAKPSAAPQRQRSRVRSDGSHVGFLSYARYAWAQVAVLLCVISGAIYGLVDVEPRHNGGSWYGYLLGTIGVLQILWLTMLGLRKRLMTSGAWSLKAWTSAHVYLGLSLIVIGTLHTGFQLGYNVHTLAYVLMMLVIISGIFGVLAYATLPRALSNNREEMTETQMLEGLRSLDRQLHDAAQGLAQAEATIVQRSLDADPFGGGLIGRLSASSLGCATGKALTSLAASGAAHEKLVSLLERKRDLLRRVRRHLQIKGWLEVWLYVHVPVTIALIAALVAHIVSVFFYW